MAVTLTLGGERLTIDATVSQAHGADVDVTTHPIEAGAAVTDHVLKRPETLRLDCVVADYPRPTNGVQAGAQGRSRAIYERLLASMSAGELIEVETRLRTYRNVIVQSLQSPVDSAVAGGARFSLTFSEIRIVGTKRVAASAGNSRARKTQGKLKDGKKGTTEATASERGKSVLVRVVDGIFGKPGVK